MARVPTSSVPRLNRTEDGMATAAGARAMAGRALGKRLGVALALVSLL